MMATRITTLAILDEAAQMKEREASLLKDKKISELEVIVTNLKKQLVKVQEIQRDRRSETSEREKPHEYDLIDEILDEVEENEQRISESREEQEEEAEEEEEENKEQDDNDNNIAMANNHIDNNRKNKRIDIESSNDETDQEDNDYDDGRKKQKQFWINLKNKLQKNDIESIKYLIKRRELKINEIDENGNNLLMLSSKYGLYDIAILCINLGSPLNKRNKFKQTALDIAKTNGFPEIQELLIMQQLKRELAEKISYFGKNLSQQEGITSNFIHILKNIFASQEQIYSDDEDNVERQTIDSESNYSFSKRKAISNAFLTTVAQALSGLNYIFFVFKT